MVELQPQTDTGTSRASREEMIDNVARDILERLPENFKYDEIRMQYGLEVQPTTVVLLQGVMKCYICYIIHSLKLKPSFLNWNLIYTGSEIQRFNGLLTRMRLSIKSLRRALAGEVGMSNELDDVASSLYKGHIPGNH